MKTQNEERVERHRISCNSEYYNMLCEFCKSATRLYNHANYIVRQEFINNHIWLRYNDLDRILKLDKAYPDYYNTPVVQASQQILRILDKNWKSFFNSIKDWKKHPEKYLGRPKLPNYKSKDSLSTLILTNQNCKSTGDKIIFPKSFNGFCITTKIRNKQNFNTLQQVRLVPEYKSIIVEIVYSVKAVEPISNDRYIGIDIGLNNLATVCNNFGKDAFIINGKPIKSINHYYNKKSAHYDKIYDRNNHIKTSNRKNKLSEDRKAKIDDYLHKASRYIINYCLDNNVSTIIIGKNNGWKQNINIGKVTNQNFVQIPFNRLIDMIQYKAKDSGITVILTEESYTSGTSFIDNEEPIKENYNKNRRIYRGLFRSNNGILINADLNAAYQIIKKAVPIKWDIGCVLHPFVVNIT